MTKILPLLLVGCTPASPVAVTPLRPAPLIALPSQSAHVYALTGSIVSWSNTPVISRGTGYVTIVRVPTNTTAQ